MQSSVSGSKPSNGDFFSFEPVVVIASPLSTAVAVAASTTGVTLLSVAPPVLALASPIVCSTVNASAIIESFD